MKHLKTLTLVLLVAFSWAANAQVDTVSVWSESMKKDIKNVVITPADYSKDKKAEYPVVYLLHGATGAHWNWIKKAPFLPDLATQYGLIIVCPDGDAYSWYWDSPIDSTYRYETYMMKELIPYIDKNYRTQDKRTARAICGLSMGGQGALYLAWRHQDVFGACASMSGGINIESFPANWNMEKRLGKYAEAPETWKKFNVSNMVYLLKPNSIKILIDCGTDDMFYDINCALHEQLAFRRIPHDFISRPGNHNWAYWTNSVKYHLLFFDSYFEEEAEKERKAAEKAAAAQKKK